MNILYIADSTSTHTQRWLKYFLKSGYDIHIITLGRKKKKIPGVNHIANFESFYYNSLSFFSILLKTRAIIDRLKPDILHAHFVHQYGWLAALCNFHPFILTAWGTDILHLPYTSRFKIGKWLTQYALRKADTLTGISDHLKHEMVKLGANENNTNTVFCGVDTTKFHPGVNYKKLKQELAIKNSQPVVLSNRNHVALYNNDIVIKAMTKVLKVYPDAVLIMQNSGGKLENELKDLAQTEGITKSVRFLPQFDYDRMPEIYALSDVYVSIPTWDAGPVSLKEAMASGSVPIISNIPAPMEWIKNDHNGKVVSVKSVNQLVDAIIELLSDEKKRSQYAYINRQLVQKKAEHETMMKQIDKIYQSVYFSSMKKR